MKRYSKKVREEAALICAIAASTPGLWNYQDVCAAAGIPCTGAANTLAYGAWCSIAGRESLTAEDLRGCQVDAEAESLIRSGWSPS